MQLDVDVTPPAFSKTAWGSYYHRLISPMYIVVKFHASSYHTFRDMNFLLVRILV